MPMRIGRARQASRKQPDRRRIIFATDLHGSEVVFRKFLNAISVYEADVAILGGDLTGKRLAPIVRGPTGFDGEVAGGAVHAEDESALEPILERIRSLGHYPIVISPDELATMRADPKLVDRYFERECHLQVADWMRRAAERLSPLGVPLYVTGGNDDYLSIEGVLDEAEWITNAEGQVLEVAPGLEMISTGYGNPTPWQCPRDVSEAELGSRIESMARMLDNSSRAVFNFHVPPFGSGLDRCPKLDTSVSPPKPITGVEIAAGSTAVSDALRRYEPVLSLHGHIHESAGICEIGHTIAINPGSEYGEGVLRCAVIDIEDGRVMAQLLSA
jgi:uncharacterized protein